MPYVPLTWLADHVKIPAGTTAADLAAALVQVGLEEEQILPPAVTGPLVVGRVLSIRTETHSNGKTIAYCRVDVGPEHNDPPGQGKEPAEVASRGIVCGAHNFTVGDDVVVALPGTTLPGDFHITARRTYGHLSDGMICSAAELGLGEDHTGIIVLGEYLPGADIPEPGADAIELLGLGAEVLEINVTPDRGYCFAMRGVAREYSHATGAPFTDPGLPENLPGGLPPQATPDGFAVHVDDDEGLAGNVGCSRFVTRIVRGIDPAAPSPAWMTKRLTQAGMRPISLAVDVTNYVMLDLGQPLHAYDLDTVHAPIVVRRARAGERLTTLDDVDRTLDPEDLLITDSPDANRAGRVLGLAGVMGGAQTEVSPATTAVLIEAAHFDPVTVARTARRHKLPSEAAKRFERGVDPALQAVAAQRVVDLLVQYGGGTADPAVSDLDHTTRPAPIDFRLDEAERLTGRQYPHEVVVELLQRIGAQVSRACDGVVTVTPPSWRPDLVGPAHLVEEVARLDGYDRIPAILPTARAGRGLTPGQRARRDVARALADLGLVEVLSYPFIGDSHDRQQLAADDDRRQVLTLANPMADDIPALRTRLLDTLLDTARRNISRGLDHTRVFELGLVTHPAGMQQTQPPGVDRRPSPEQIADLYGAVPRQPRHVAGVLAGTVVPQGPHVAARALDWADAVEAARVVAATLGIGVQVEAAQQAPWHPGRCAAIRTGTGVVGYAGELHPRVADAFDLPRGTAAFEMDLDALQAAAPSGPVQPEPVSTYPPSKEDIALVVGADVPAGQVLDTVREAIGDLAEEVHLFDVYTGAQLPPGQKSLAFALRLRASDRTLTGAETARVREQVVALAAERHGARLRE